MKIKVLANMAILSTDLGADLVEKAIKLAPEALVLTKENRDGEEVEYFRVSVGSKPSVNKYGVTFVKTTEGKLQARIEIPTEVKAADRTAYIKDAFGAALVNLTVIENNLPEMVEEAVHAYDSLDTAITIVE